MNYKWFNERNDKKKKSNMYFIHVPGAEQVIQHYSYLNMKTYNQNVD